MSGTCEGMAGGWFSDYNQDCNRCYRKNSAEFYSRLCRMRLNLINEISGAGNVDAFWCIYFDGSFYRMVAFDESRTLDREFTPKIQRLLNELNSELSEEYKNAEPQ